MSVIRVNKNKENPYLIMNKTGLNDDKLSLKAKGLLCYLLSLPDDWRIYENELITHHKDGRDSIRSAIKELLDNGYIERERQRNEKGYLKEYEYVVYEVPKSGKSNVGKTNIGKSDTTKYKPILNNNKLNNKNNKGVKSKKLLLYTFLELDLYELEEDAMEVIQYYISKYYMYFDIELKYTVEEWKDIFDNILYSSVHGDLEQDILIEAIDKHFETKYEHNEMYLLHNFKGATKDNRLYEVGIL